VQKYTIRDFEREFPDDDVCLEWLKNHLSPNGNFCKNCQRITKHHRMSSRRSYSCDHCGNHVHPTAGTIYHKSSTPLRLWFYAIYLMASTRCGIAAKQLQRELGVTYKTAWRMFSQIRKMLAEDRGPFSGEVEVDETYVGGRRSGGKRGRGAPGKTIVAGVAQRGSAMAGHVVPNVRKATMEPVIEATVAKGATVYTDELASYNGLVAKGYEHAAVNHSAGIYAEGRAHTNTVEGFGSLLKGGLRGVYRSVSPKYLQSYVDEYASRYSHRKDSDPMFMTFLRQARPLYG
jgi:transposase